MQISCLLDTSFFIRLLNSDDPLHKNAKGYYKYLLEKNQILKISTISIAEYCAGGSISDLPLLNLQILPFNTDHAKQAGALGKIMLRNTKKLNVDRKIVINDLKLFAQADIDSDIKYYLTSDTESAKIFSKLSGELNLRFQFIDIREGHHSVFGELNFEP